MSPRRGWKKNFTTGRYEPPSRPQEETDMMTGIVEESKVDMVETSMSLIMPRVRSGTQIHELAGNRSIDVIIVMEGYSVTYQDYNGDKTAFYGGFAHTVDLTGGVLYVHPDPTSVTQINNGVVAIIQSEFSDEDQQRKMETLVFYPDHFDSLVLNIKH